MRHDECPNRGDWLTIEDRLPRHPGIGGPADAAVHGSKIESPTVSGHSRDGNHTPTAEWANHSPLQGAEQIGRDGLRGDWEQWEKSN